MNTKLKLYFRNCPVCNCKSYKKFFTKKNFKKIDSNNKIYLIDKFYVQCKNCNLVYTNPTVKSEVFDKIYEETVVGSFRNLDDKNTEYKKLDYFIELFKKEKNFTNNSEIRNILEIGCGQGKLLKEVSNLLKLKKKNIYGIEPSKKIYQFLKNQKFGVFKRSFLKDVKVYKKFDLILMDNVFEHFDHPNTELKTITKLMSSKGIIYLSIPNIFNLNFNYEDPMNHTCNYSRENIKYVLNKNNFIIKQISLRDRVINILAEKKMVKKIDNKNFKKLQKKFSNLKLKLENNKIKFLKQTTKALKISKNIKLNNQKVFIFGSGNYSLNILKKLNINKNIVGYIDSNKIYHRSKRNKFRVYSPENALKMKYDKIIIASQAFKREIYNFLINNKVKKTNIIYF